MCVWKFNNCTDALSSRFQTNLDVFSLCILPCSKCLEELCTIRKRRTGSTTSSKGVLHTPNNLVLSLSTLLGQHITFHIRGKIGNTCSSINTQLISFSKVTLNISECYGSGSWRKFGSEHKLYFVVKSRKLQLTLHCAAKVLFTYFQNRLLCKKWYIATKWLFKNATKSLKMPLNCKWHHRSPSNIC